MALQKTSAEYSRTAVPEADTVSGWRVALIKLGVVIALPAFVMGSHIGASLGLKLGSLSILVGGLLLMVMGMLTGTVAARSRLSTSLITQFAFGRLGGRFVNAVLAATLLGWFGVTAQIFGESLQGCLVFLHLAVWPAQVYVVLGGTLMIATTVFGFSALQRVSDITVPLLLVVMLIAAYRSFALIPPGEMTALPGSGGSLVTGVSAIVGGLAAGICVFPDLCRFARTGGQARLAAGLIYAAGLPLVLILAVITSVASAQHDIVPILTTLGLGLPALVLLVFKAWATNSGNLYSASLGLASVFPGQRPLIVVIAGGVLGVVLAAAGIASHFVPFLLVLSIAIPPIAGIYVADFFLLRGKTYDLEVLDALPRWRYPAFLAWALGIAAATASSRGLVTLTTVPAADSILISSALYFVFAKYLFRSAAGSETLAGAVSAPRPPERKD